MDDSTPVRMNRRRTDREGGASHTRPAALAVDDDPSFLRLIERQLESIGFDVTVSPSGESAAELCETRDFDLVLLDLQMPGINGFETLDRIRACREQPYSILLTANDGLDVRIDAFSRGFDDFLSKKAGPEEIAGKLNAARRMLSIHRRLKDENSELMQLAITDQLTGLSNRLYLFSRARSISSSQVRLNVLVFDIDDFESTNQRFGTLFGDRILADIGALFRRSVRATDVASRLGGDEFVLLVPEIEEQEAEQVALRLQRAIETLEWRISGETVRVTCSSGMASSEGRERSLPEILAECDQKLRRSRAERQER